MAERWRVLAGGLGLLALVAVGAVGPVRPALPVEGEAEVRGAALWLGPGARLALGKGERVEVEGEGEAYELFLGEEGAARVVGRTIQLVDTEGQAMVSIEPRPLPAGQAPWLRCSGRLEAGAGPGGIDHGPSRGPCGAQQAGVQALSAVLLHQARVDGQPVALVQRGGPEPLRAGLVLALGLALWALLDLHSLLPLLLSPLALVLPVPAEAVLAVLGGACGLVRGGGRGLAVALLSLPVAAGLVLGPAVQGAAAPTAGTEVAARALAPTVGPALLERKVDEMEQATRPAVEAAGRPLVVALGGSSSGGGTTGRFWPQVLQEQLQGRASVVSLAWGGATTWHLQQVLARHGVQAEICLLYVGHNDLSAALPGRSIRQVLAGQEPTGSGLVAPVPVADAATNIQAMRPHCRHILAIQERVAGREAIMASYAAMLAAQDGVRWADGQQLVPAEDLMDDVHLHPAGHERFAGALLPLIEDWLPPPR